MDDAKLLRNVKLSYWIRACLYSWVTIPTLALYYIDRGLTLSDLIYLKAALSAVALILEIPSGYLADVVGRKKTAILGGLFWLGSIAVYINSEGFYYFLMAEVLLGVATSLLSGTDSALVFDSLKVLKREADYKKIESQMGSVNGFAEAGGGLLGAFLASLSLVYPFYLQFLLVFSAVLLMFFLKEPPREERASGVNPWRGIFDAVSFALFRHRGVRSLILFYGVSACSTLLLVWLAQGYMKAIELPTVYFGVAWAVFHLFLGFGSLISHRLDDFFGAFGVFRAMIVVTFLSFLMLGLHQSVVGLFFIVLLYIVRGVRMPLFRYYVNNHTSSDVRATILSVQGFSVRFFAIIAGPILAKFIEYYSLSAGLILLSILSLVLLSVSLILIQRSGVLHLDADKSLS